jgi:hypothetical protein
MQKYSARLSRAKIIRFNQGIKNGARGKHFSRWTEESNVQRPAMGSRGEWRLLCSFHPRGEDDSVETGGGGGVGSN